MFKMHVSFYNFYDWGNPFFSSFYDKSVAKNIVLQKVLCCYSFRKILEISLPKLIFLLEYYTCFLDSMSSSLLLQLAICRFVFGISTFNFLTSSHISSYLALKRMEYFFCRKSNFNNFYYYTKLTVPIHKCQEFYSLIL